MSALEKFKNMPQESLLMNGRALFCQGAGVKMNQLKKVFLRKSLVTDKEINSEATDLISPTISKHNYRTKTEKCIGFHIIKNGHPKENFYWLWKTCSVSRAK